MQPARRALRWKRGKDNAQRLIGTTAFKAPRRPTEREMKLTDLFSRARRRAHYPDRIEAPAPLVAADRSSMADLVRLLKEADEAQKGSGPQPA